MEEKKSVFSSNQIENYDKDFQFPGNLVENESYSRTKQYKRDMLLHLRLHPLSLQKPNNLPDIEVVKGKLYLHTVEDSCPSGDKCIDQNFLKSDYCNMKHEYPLLPNYYNRLYPYCVMYNGFCQSSSSKLRSTSHSYSNPLKKHCLTSHSSYKDFSEENLWAKRCYTSSEGLWNYYPTNVNSNCTKNKENVDTVPKSRKKISIIDPVTGKDILEAATSSDIKNDRYSNEEKLECSGSCNADIPENYSDDYFSNAKGTGKKLFHNTGEVSKDSITCNSEDDISNENLKNSHLYHSDFIDKKSEDVPNFEKACANTSVTEDYEKNVKSNTDAKAESSTVDSTAAKENVFKMIKNDENLQFASEADKLLNKQVPTVLKAKGGKNPADIHGNCLTHCKKEGNLRSGKENVFKEHDLVKESLKQLREKIYSLNQDQQKMAILKSFLRFKKYELEETARNLDEKRIEIANWECNLSKKAKWLLDKEQWLDNRNEMLLNKAQQLTEREKMIIKEEKKVACESRKLRCDLKETQFSERKFMLDNCGTPSWDEYTHFTCSSTPNKILKDSLNAEKCESDGSTLDELEKNIVFMEKMNASNEAGDTNFENKAEHASSNILQKKDNSSCESLGQSRGRRYLPEHIKYWLNKRDKNSL